jgi:tRNA pseudouridine55 synthase
MAGELKNKYIIWKNLGETPLEALTRLATELDIPKEVPLTYAGRLDPAAEGLLIILTGEECKKKEEYTSLPKTYMVEILIDISTDSFDLLGIPNFDGEAKSILKNAKEYLDEHIGMQMQKYPPYSSKTVDGKQLHTHAREGTSIEIPEHEVNLVSYDDLSVEEILSEDVLVRVGEITSAVTGDFRQGEIVEAWANIKLPEKLALLEVTLNVGSGFYIRQLAEDLGRHLGTGACLYSLIRTQVGEYSKADF